MICVTYVNMLFYYSKYTVKQVKKKVKQVKQKSCQCFIALVRVTVTIRNNSPEAAFLIKLTDT